MPRPLGITSLQILAAIRDGVSYGLELVTETGLPSGTVYPTLGRMKSKGLVQARWEDGRIADEERRPRRRYYTLTPAGADALAEGAARHRSVAASLAPKTEGA